MKVIKVQNQVEGGKKAFEIIKENLKQGNLKVLGLATGSTPETLYQEMVDSDLDFSNVVSVNLDEYEGLKPTDTQSYHYFMQKHLFDAKPFKESYIPDGLGGEEACEKYEEILAANPIDIQILGIGQNGHIGFNEPGTSFDERTHLVDLTKSTIEANKRFFDKVEDVPTRAISMGIKSIMSAKHIILLAYGENKADAIAGTINGKVTEELPASVLQNHSNVTVIVDEAAGSKL